MLSDKTCAKYKEWKKKQKRSKDPKKKIKKAIRDCIEEEKKTKTIVKIHYHKCEKNGKSKKKERKFKPKLVSSIDLLIRRIKPSLDVRYQFLNPRHTQCFVEKLSEIHSIALKETAQQERKKPKQKRKRKKKITKATDREKETKLEEKAATADEEGNETKEETANGEITDRDKAKEKKKKRKDKFWCKKFKKKIESTSESEDSECESICSFDSEICLKG
ncbi:peptidyl-prolyl isomerase cwc27-like [Vespula squamosa]|uniref:Peptidyl-prolyl isomerase cwc27-like n=1 Tax=Vespula squamosa TaxID=30214 RepID=A0ABD1ZTS3_VESSQ